MRNRNITTMLCVAALTGACSSSSQTNMDAEQGSPEGELPELLTGVFLDSAVAGLSYRAGEQLGVTNALGEFAYVAGEPVQFSLGDIHLPEVPAVTLVTPYEIFSTRNPASVSVQNLARLLQSLDLDADLTNGIEIGPDAVLSAMGLNVDFSAADFDSQVFNLVANSGSSRTALISAENAMLHLNTTIENNGLEAIGCTKTHPLVGRTAQFNGEFHDVGGTVTVIDDCTLEVSEFTYDGGGPDVAFYGGLNQDYSSTAGGVRLGPRLNGRTYTNETIRLNLPDGVTLDDIDSLSVWCFDVAVSFGDVYFGR